MAALRALALDGYPVGLTIAPVMPLPGWRSEYGALLRDVRSALAAVLGADVTVELITHRFTEASRAVLLGWYPQTKLDLDESTRSVKRSKFGGMKICLSPAAHVRDADVVLARTRRGVADRARPLLDVSA